jgi:2-polyprenyl-3-methyl-5-hydroxy-6-metoxy-1,4-benzoquinol methylase
MAIKFFHSLPHVTFTENRATWIRERSAGRRVIHIGCVDAGMDGQSDANLHRDLVESTAFLVGVDVDTAGIERMRAAGIDNLFLGDVATDAALRQRIVTSVSGNADLIIAGEVLEHVRNAGGLLDGLREMAVATGADVVVTVPNALAFRAQLASIRRRIELVHEDHVAYYSPVTLANAVSRAGLQVDEMLGYSYASDRVQSGPKRLARLLLQSGLLKHRPHLGEGLICLCHPTD